MWTVQKKKQTYVFEDKPEADNKWYKEYSKEVQSTEMKQERSNRKLQMELF